MTTLLILAYNEEKTLGALIDKLSKEFNYIILIDDNSSDKTQSIVKKYTENKNFIYHKNEKNLGAGKSFEKGVHIFNELNSEYLLKIDGDAQFKIEDIKKIKNLGIKEKFDFIKGDRFWENGIEGKIPFIRYFGNALASFLIKLSTGNWKINDPLNGLFFISKKAALDFSLSKLFNRYGYPFYLVTYISNKAKSTHIKFGQYQNTIIYGNERSDLKANVMLFKLLYFTFVSFYKKIKTKMKYSNLQFSALIDILAHFFLAFSIFSFYKLVSIRYYSSEGPQGSWFLVVTLFMSMFFILLSLSQKTENNSESNELIIIKNK